MKKPVIVCIDDEPDILNSLKIELKKVIGDQCIIETAEGGEDALELLALLQADEHEIALVLSDYIMPDIKGDELLRQIHEKSPDTLTIMLTGQADLEALSNTIKYAKLYRYIPKPWQCEDLQLTVVEAVHSYLQDQKLTIETLKRKEANQELKIANEELKILNEELEEVNEQLSAKENRLRQFLGALPMGVSVYHPDGSIAYFNHAAGELLSVKNILGTTAQQLPEKKESYNGDHDQLYFPDNFPIWRALQGEFVKVDDVEISQYGLIISLEISATPIYDSSGNIVYAIAAIQDVSERKEAEKILANYQRTLEAQIVERTEQLQQAALAAESANRAKSTFLANMSHELRTPLNGILGFTQIMESSPNATPEDLENIKIIHRSGEHLLTLINQALDLAKIEAGRMTLDLKDFDLYRLLDELQDMFQLRSKYQDLQLVFECSADVPQYVQTDNIKLRQVLINLLNNAIKFTQTGGVSLTVTKKNDVDINSSLFLQFKIEDTGIGIPPEELDNIFQPFVQTELDQGAQKGTGLGLTISRQFVRLMGGDIIVKSKRDQGSIFEFEIQVNVVNPDVIYVPEIDRKVIGLEANQPSYRILIVDDREDNRLLLVKLLSPLGFLVQQASNGLEAVEIWENWHPHLIFMDLLMPVMDGYEATLEIRLRIREREEDEQINKEIRMRNTSATLSTSSELPISKIVALTASIIDREKRSFALLVGCDDFISKPFSKTDIFDAIEKHLGVKYIYFGSTSDRPQLSDSISDFSIGFMPKLPVEWIDNMRQVIRSADFDLIANTIEEIRDSHAELANILQGHLDDFDYQKIFNLITVAEELDNADENK
ncbi:response regulator [Tychonema sp. BBK16]|uniref:response regulator n=1 Tax=Tychonema sp. BBK16 TaxID=2699888 RepID=UPI001F1C505B|nr:response regulator [Tychonema sp. BBK16]MCF6372856.1 response regulator [Tychonema sp. BBK16]